MMMMMMMRWMDGRNSNLDSTHPMEAWADSHNIHEDSGQNLPFDTSQSFVQCHDLLECIGHESNRRASLQPVPSYPYAMDSPPLHLLYEGGYLYYYPITLQLKEAWSGNDEPTLTWLQIQDHVQGQSIIRYLFI